ncbi:MAG: response regulator [Methanobacteriota archaeon]|nr:MAG: response regulator [Euryarchaeota archaeon]
MKGVYARTNQVAEVIQNIKLSLAAWKVLFIIDGKTDLEKFEHVLGLNEDELKSAINELKDLDLIQAVGEEPIAVEEEEMIAQIEEFESEEHPQAEAASELEEEAHEIEEEVDDLAKDLESFMDVELEEDNEKLIQTEEKLQEESELGDLISQIQEEQQVEETPATQESAEMEMEEIDEEDLLADLEKDLQDFMLEEEKTEEEAVQEALEEEIVQSANTSELDELLSDEILEGVEAETKKAEEPQAKPLEAPVEEPAQPAEEPAPSMKGTKTVMVVDDSVVIRKMVEIALENEPIEVISAPTGKEALSKLDEEEVHLVILDLMLPDLNGLDILKAIKAASANLPVIILTGKDSSKDLEMAKEYGADDFVTKPFKDEDLLSKVKSLL